MYLLYWSTVYSLRKMNSLASVLELSKKIHRLPSTQIHFLGISQSTLTYILGNDHLNMEEIDIFKRSCAWAESKNQTTPVRHVLGKALYKSRFPTMTLSEFTNVVRKTDVLNMEEQHSIYAYLSVPDDVNKPSQFGCTKRSVRKGMIFTISHFK